MIIITFFFFFFLGGGGGGGGGERVLLCGNISVYIRLTPREREGEKRDDRREKIYCKQSRPLPYFYPS